MLVYSTGQVGCCKDYINIYNRRHLPVTTGVINDDGIITVTYMYGSTGQIGCYCITGYNGVVNGDLIVGGGNVTILGKVTGNVRAAGGNIIFSSLVDKNATILGGSISMSRAYTERHSTFSALPAESSPREYLRRFRPRHTPNHGYIPCVR